MPMEFPYLRAARVKLQERKNTCLLATWQSAAGHVWQFLEFTRQDPVLRAVMTELEKLSNQKFPDISQWIDQQERRVRLPDRETETAALNLRLLYVFAEPLSTEPSYRRIPGINTVFGHGSSHLEDWISGFLQEVLLPLYRYLDERIDDGDLLLYMLCRFQRECTWFERSRLIDLVAQTASRQIEAVLDQHLREWLFREGFDYPFSTPRSPSGRADIIVWHGEEPLPIEVKVFDAQNRDAGHVSQGLWQAFRYATDYGTPFGYLVVFNISNAILAFEGADPAATVPPCITVGDKPMFAVVVNLHPDPQSASKEQPRTTIPIPRPSGPS